MKKKFLIAISAVIVFALAAVAFAYNRTQATQNAASASCPMHKQMASNAEGKDSCCGMADCCKDGKCAAGGACCKSKDSCPMKSEPKAESEMNMSRVNFVMDESCCQKGAACCQGGACCHKNQS